MPMKHNDLAQRLKTLETKYHDLHHKSELKYAQLKEEMDEKADALTSDVTLLKIEVQKLTLSLSQLQQQRKSK
ncbi:hypothetical protein HDU98_002698 [Podochytrium sp. JEL0797]|nr:hypothetical protein HDU98_002698 [Podochytrium sp. JEL0797]